MKQHRPSATSWHGTRKIVGSLVFGISLPTVGTISRDLGLPIEQCDVCQPDTAAGDADAVFPVSRSGLGYGSGPYPVDIMLFTTRCAKAAKLYDWALLDHPVDTEQSP